ncbi:hypothetical protein Pmar_PMAR013268, partial [Perkinsus marinus ATCC 50983]
TPKSARSRSGRSRREHPSGGRGRAQAPVEYSEWLKSAVQHLPKPQTAESMWEYYKASCGVRPTQHRPEADSIG